jgi:hypothetical protein
LRGWRGGPERVRFSTTRNRQQNDFASTSPRDLPLLPAREKQEKLQRHDDMKKQEEKRSRKYI